FFCSYATNAHFHSFPTRRSSDLVQAVEVPARARDRHGGRARFFADARVHRERAERVGRERPRVRARRARRYDGAAAALLHRRREDRKSTRLNSSHVAISYAVFCL